MNKKYKDLPVVSQKELDEAVKNPMSWTITDYNSVSKFYSMNTYYSEKERNIILSLKCDEPLRIDKKYLGHVDHEAKKLILRK